MRLGTKTKRTAMPVVKLALDKALAQLVVAQNAASLSGEDDIAAAIAAATDSLHAVVDNMRTKTGAAHLY